MLEKIYYWFRKKISKPEERGEPSSGYWQSKVREVAFDICNLKEGRILEVGCGEGLFLNKFFKKRSEIEIFGVDIFPKQLLKAKERLNLRSNRFIRLFRADAACLPFKDNSFDRIVCINVFMNMPQDIIVDKSLQDIRRVCKKEGRIIFDIRNVLNPLVRIKYKLAKYYDATIDSRHLRMYDLSKMEKKLQSLGVIVAKKITIGFPEGKFAPVAVIEAVKK